MGGLILAIDLGKFNSVCCWYDTASRVTITSPSPLAGEGPGVRVFAARRTKNCPAAEVVRRALNPSDAKKTDQENLSPSVVRQAHFFFLSELLVHHNLSESEFEC